MIWWQIGALILFCVLQVAVGVYEAAMRDDEAIVTLVQMAALPGCRRLAGWLATRWFTRRGKPGKVTIHVGPPA